MSKTNKQKEKYDVPGERHKVTNSFLIRLTAYFQSAYFCTFYNKVHGSYNVINLDV